MQQLVKLVIFVPKTHADIVRKAMGDAEIGGRRMIITPNRANLLLD